MEGGRGPVFGERFPSPAKVTWERAKKSALKHRRFRPSETPVFQRVFQRGVSEGCFRPLGGFPEGFCVMYPGGNLVKIPHPEGQIGQGTSTERFVFEISAEDGLDVLVGNSACSFSATMLGKPRFRGGVSEGCFRGVFQTPWLEGPLRAR